MEQSVESNFFKKFKAIASLPILRPYFSFFFKERFFRKSSKPGHGNLVLITSTVQVELSKLNFNFDDIRTNFFKFFIMVCQDCCAMITLDRTRTEQNRAELILTIKIYNSSFM